MKRRRQMHPLPKAGVMTERAPGTGERVSRALLYALAAAAIVWAASELLEIALAGRTALTLWLTAAFHLLMVPGVQGAQAVRAGGHGLLSRGAATMASLGYLFLVVPPLAVARTPEVTILDFMGANPLFRVAGALAVLGTMLFGIAILRARSCPAWVGIALVVCPAIFSAVMGSGGPDVVAVVANLVQAGAWMTIASRGLRRRRVVA